MTGMLDVLLKNPDSVVALADRPAVLLLRPIFVLTTISGIRFAIGPAIGRRIS